MFRDKKVIVYKHESNIGYGGNQKTCYRLALEAGTYNFFIALFKWANKGYVKNVWLDTKMMPRILSTVLLVKCVLHENHKQ